MAVDFLNYCTVLNAVILCRPECNVIERKRLGFGHYFSEEKMKRDCEFVYSNMYLRDLVDFAGALTVIFLVSLNYNNSSQVDV